MERFWLKNYPPGVPADIDPSVYPSVVSLLEESFAKYRDAKAYVCMDKALTFGEVDTLSKALAAWLQGRGLTRGARVAIMMPNVLQYPVALAAVLRAGLIAVNVNPLYTARELEHQLKDSGAEAVIVLENFASALQQAIASTAVKHVVVAAMGNDNTSSPSYPAAYPSVIAVGATDQLDHRAPFSNTGSHIDVSAPGVDVLSTVWDNGFASMSGTSMATPHVAGVAALVRSCNASLTADQVGAIIRETARPLRDAPADPVPNDRYGAGLVDAAAAVARACPIVRPIFTRPWPLRPIFTRPTFITRPWPLQLWPTFTRPIQTRPLFATRPPIIFGTGPLGGEFDMPQPGASPGPQAFTFPTRPIPTCGRASCATVEALPACGGSVPCPACEWLRNPRNCFSFK